MQFWFTLSQSVTGASKYDGVMESLPIVREIHWYSMESPHNEQVKYARFPIFTIIKAQYVVTYMSRYCYPNVESIRI